MVVTRFFFDGAYILFLEASGIVALYTAALDAAAADDYAYESRVEASCHADRPTVPRSCELISLSLTWF